MKRSPMMDFRIREVTMTPFNRNLLVGFLLSLRLPPRYPLRAPSSKVC